MVRTRIKVRVRDSIRFRVKVKVRDSIRIRVMVRVRFKDRLVGSRVRGKVKLGAGSMFL